MNEISQELDALACGLIGAALEMLERGDTPPIMAAVDCSDDLASFEDDTPDGCYRAACEYVTGLKGACSRYAVVYPGVVQEDEASTGDEALLFEFAERGMETAWSGYVLYRTAPDGAIESTDPLPAGEEELLFG